jgi:hypothetical protein
MNSLRLTERQLVLCIIAFALLIRCAVVIVLKTEPVSDYAGYDQMARNLLAGKVMADDFGSAAFLSGGYPLFVLAPIYAIFGHSFLAAQLANAVLGAASTALVYLLLREARAGVLARVGGALLFALYVPSWVYGEYLAKENLMTPLMLLLVYLSARLHSNMQFLRAIAAGVTAALLAITGTAALALLPVVVCAIALARASMNKKLSISIVTMLAMVLTLTPWLYRNAQVVGSPVISSNGGFNLYLGNNPNADGYFVSIGDTPRGADWKELRAKGEVYASAQLKSDAINWILDNPATFTGLALKKAVLFWLPPTHEGKGEPSTLEKVVRHVWLIQYLIVCALALYVVATLKEQNRVVLAVTMGIVLYTGVHMLFYVIFRYREPIMPMVIMLAAVGIERLALRFAASPAQSPASGEHAGASDEVAPAVVVASTGAPSL